jgi:hypothetical protein
MCGVMKTSSRIVIGLNSSLRYDDVSRCLDVFKGYDSIYYSNTNIDAEYVRFVLGGGLTKHGNIDEVEL